MSATDTAPGKREAELIALSDLELVTHAYDLVREIENNNLEEEFYFVLGEVFERFAPDAEWENRLRSYDTLEERRFECEASRAYLATRAAARWMARSVDDA